LKTPQGREWIKFQEKLEGAEDALNGTLLQLNQKYRVKSISEIKAG